MSNEEESIFSSSRLLTDEEFQKYRDLSKPGESHELLKRYVGNWTYESTVRMEPNGPEYTGHGNSCYCTIMEGRFVKGCYVGAPPPKSSPVPAFSGFELIGFSNVRNEYQATWIDNMSTLQSKSSGKYDKSSNKLLMEGCHDKAPDEMGVKFRTVTSFPSENQMIYELYSIDSKTKEEFRTLHLKSTRRKSPTHISSVSIISLLTDDIDATRDWYCEKLGFMVKKDVTCDAPSTDRWCVIKPPQAMKGASISITNAETQSAKQVIGKQAGDGWLLVLETNDIQSDFEELKKKGVKFEKDKPEEKSYGIDIVLFDPLGNKINLVQCNKCKSCK